MLIELCSCALAVPSGTSILLLDNFFFHRNLMLGILNFTGLSTGLTSIVLRAQPWYCCKLPIKLTLFLLKVKIHWNLGISTKGGKIAMRICYSKVLFHYFIITGVKNIIHQTQDFITVKYVISKLNSKHCYKQVQLIRKRKPKGQPYIRDLLYVWRFVILRFHDCNKSFWSPKWATCIHWKDNNHQMLY